MSQDELRVYRLTRDFKEFPYWRKGKMFGFENDTGIVWGMKNKTMTNSFPLRTPLAGYCWLLLSEKGIFKKVSFKED
jgi:hypothetical protein